MNRIGVFMLIAIIVALLAVLIIRESPGQAYERGYEDARSVSLDTLYNRWFNDSLGWGYETEVIDDTDESR